MEVKAQLFFLYPNYDAKEKYDVHEKEGSRYKTSHGQKYQCCCTTEGEPQKHSFASMVYSQAMDGVIIHSFVEVMAFGEVLHSFGNQLLWKYFHCDGDGEWIHRGLMMGSLVILHDGSYM